MSYLRSGLGKAERRMTCGPTKNTWADFSVGAFEDISTPNLGYVVDSIDWELIENKPSEIFYTAVPVCW